MINPDPLSTPHSTRRNEGPHAPVIDVVVKGMRSESNIRTSGGVRRLVLLYTSNKRDKITFKNMSLLSFLIIEVSRVHGQDRMALDVFLSTYSHSDAGEGGRNMAAVLLQY